MLYDWNSQIFKGGIEMFSKETITKAMKEFRANMDKEGIMYDLDGDTIDLTIQGEVVHMWFNFEDVELSNTDAEVLRLVDSNDAKWYVLATMLNSMIEELKSENNDLHERIEELEAKCDQYRIQIDDMEADEMAPSLIDAIDMEGGNVDDLIKYHSQVAGGSDEEE
jgi:predicted RNase H-like nuclease (RuvC/YqgF family)